MNKNLFKIHDHYFLKIIFCAMLIFAPATLSFGTTCSDLDSAASMRITEPLCDTLELLQDNDYASVSIIAKGLPNVPVWPPKGTDSATIRQWYDSVYLPWSAKNMALINANADTIISQYDLRTLNDTNSRLLTINRDHLPRIDCKAKKSTVLQIAQTSYVEPIFRTK